MEETLPRVDFTIAEGKPPLEIQSLTLLRDGLALPDFTKPVEKSARFNYIANPHSSPGQQRLQLQLLRRLHEENLATSGVDPNLEARIQSLELAFRLQTAAPETTDLSKESPATRALYGMDDPETENFGRMCLLAWRFAERDVRFLQVSYSGSLKFTNEQWAQHIEKAD